MANYVQTIVRITANRKEDLDLLLKKILSNVDYILDINKRNNHIIDVAYAVIPREVGKVDFNILIPQPTNIFQGGLNREIEVRYGGSAKCWCEWRKEHWGTTKNAHDDSVVWLSDNEVEITFWTDWEKPTIWLQTLAKYALNGELGITDISGEYANEDFGCEMGYIHINEDWYEDKENEDPLCFVGCDQDVECYNKVWGEGMAETTGYFNDNE